MNAISGLKRCTVALAIAVAAQHCFTPSAGAQDSDKVGAEERDLRPEQARGSGPAPASADADAEKAAEAIDFATTAQGGVPSEAAPSDVAVDAVQASMTRAAEEIEAGVTDAYQLTFGDTFDWVQLASGEWLKGEIKRIRDDVLEFDSDKIGMQFIDLADVTRLHSPNVNTYVFDDRISATGLAVITPDKVVVQTEEGAQIFDRSELEGMVEGGEREKDWWSMSLRFGLTLNRGNTDQLTYDILFKVRREDEMTRMDLSYNGTFGRTDGVQNVQRHLGEFDFKVFLSKRWFVTPAFGQLLNDRFQNIKLRATPAAGAGIHIIDTPNVKWDFQTGLGYQYLKYLDTSQVTGDDPQHDVFVPLYTYADFDITDDIDLTGKADLAIELTSAIDLNVAFLFLRTEQPAPPADPAAPPIEKNDYQLVVGVSLELG
jgi:hypothetical protein